MSLWDTAGHEAYRDIRKMYYPSTDVIVICFSVDNRDTLNAVRDQWKPELLEKVCINNRIYLLTAADNLSETIADRRPPSTGTAEQCGRRLVSP